MGVRTVEQLISVLQGFRGDLRLQTLRDHVGYEDGASVEVGLDDGEVVLRLR